tara:strand:+ start:32361 stop:32534 length:174 start_codon:yes stop_codon:yes gene_type:complete
MNNKTPYFNQIERQARLLRIYKKADKKILRKKPTIIEFCTQLSLFIEKSPEHSVYNL